MNHWYDARQAVRDTAREMYDRRLFLGTTGNVSQRLPTEDGTELLAITPTSMDYDSVQVDDIAVIDFDGEQVTGDAGPSMEAPLHTAIYRARPDVNAVIHAHSPFASAVSVTKLEIPPILEDQVVFLGGGIRQAPHALSRTPEQLAGTLEALGDRNAVILANHGAIGTGPTLKAATVACYILEKTAQAFLLARAAGDVDPLPAAHFDTLRVLYDRLRREPDGEGRF